MALWIIATKEFSVAVGALAAGMKERGAFPRLLDAAERARTVSDQARLNYMKHLDEHGC